MSAEYDERLIDAVGRVGPHALPSAIYDDMVMNEPHLPDPGFGRVYTRLQRLADKGILRQTTTKDGKGRDRRVYSKVTGVRHPVKRRIMSISRVLAAT